MAGGGGNVSIWIFSVGEGFDYLSLFWPYMCLHPCTKAFDLVDHYLLLDKLYSIGLFLLCGSIHIYITVASVCPSGVVSRILQV